MKRFLTITLMAVLLCGLCAGILSSAADELTDPSQVYERQIAPYEDESIQMWFEHSFKKVMTSDTTHSGMDTYTVYMGKNEIENAQFVLYSDETKTRHRATVSDFTDANGNTVDAELYYQMYINLFDLNTLAYPGATEENTFIRNGEQPDPIAPLSKINLFQLNAGKSQAFYIRLKTTEDTQPGWYSAQLDIKNSKGQIVKTATVYAYVWDFTISEKTEYETSFFLNNSYDTYGSYQKYYDYLLENRILAMDVPGNLDSSNPYLTNDRVNAIRVSASNGGNVGAYLDHYSAYSEYAEIYTDLSSMAEWDEIKNKFYFYTLDEAMSQEFIDIYGWGTGSIDDVNYRSEVLDKYWPNARKVIPYHENHAYPYYTYDKPIAELERGQAIDGLQSMIDEDSCTLWCPQYYGFTPNAEIISHGYDQFTDDAMIRTLSGTRSGNLRLGETYFNWESIFGDLRDRILSDVIIENRDDVGYDAVWAYSAGYNSGYAYPNHLIENTGLQTKMLLWQSYQLDITGYLYYGANFWNEYDDRNNDYVDYTVTGNLTGRWKVNLHPTYADGHPVFGNGMLFYKTTHSPLTNVDYVGSVRVELLRDGIEEYQMFTMLEDLRGSKAAKDIVNSVSENVISYISMPEFDRSAFDADMDDYDIMAAVRIRLGNELEEASANTCNHQYDEGKITVEPQCLVMGEIEYTCELCGAKQIESLPTLHSEADHWKKTVISEATCTEAGEIRYDCNICGYYKTETVPSHHLNEEKWVYTPHSVMTAVHRISCSVCGYEMRTENHIYRAEYTNTCTEAGVHYDTCIACEYRSKIEDVPAKGHNMIETYKAPTCKEEGHKGAECY
ncbi:MAG: DUF4091 domain-containing protein, partial [Clostridia bacterium]|nr:DUF4091 domain-containing protein [Clostridia bacterium]